MCFHSSCLSMFRVQRLLAPQPFRLAAFRFLVVLAFLYLSVAMNGMLVCVLASIALVLRSLFCYPSNTVRLYMFRFSILNKNTQSVRLLAVQHFAAIEAVYIALIQCCSPIVF